MSKEIEYLHNYIDIQRMRIDENHNIEIKVNIQNSEREIFISPMLLNPFVENAFKHGVEPSQTDCSVELSLTVEHGWLQMRCCNSVPDNTGKTAAGVGLENLRRRLSLLYAGKHSFSTTQQAGRWCTELTLELEPC